MCTPIDSDLWLIRARASRWDLPLRPVLASFLLRVDGVLGTSVGETEECKLFGCCHCHLVCGHVRVHGNCASLIYSAGSLADLSSTVKAFVSLNRWSFRTGDLVSVCKI